MQLCVLGLFSVLPTATRRRLYALSATIPRRNISDNFFPEFTISSRYWLSNHYKKQSNCNQKIHANQATPTANDRSAVIGRKSTENSRKKATEINLIPIERITQCTTHWKQNQTGHLPYEYRPYQLLKTSGSNLILWPSVIISARFSAYDAKTAAWAKNEVEKGQFRAHGIWLVCFHCISFHGWKRERKSWIFQFGEWQPPSHSFYRALFLVRRVTGPSLSLSFQQKSAIQSFDSLLKRSHFVWVSFFARMTPYISSKLEYSASCIFEQLVEEKNRSTQLNKKRKSFRFPKLRSILSTCAIHIHKNNI